MKSAGKYTNRRNAAQEKGLKRSQVCSYPLKITSTFPDRVILAIKEPSSSDASSSIFGKAEAKIVPISGPVKSLPVSTKALTPFSSSTEHSPVRYRIRRVLCQHDPISLAHFPQPVFILRIRSEVVVVDFDQGSRPLQGLGNYQFAERPIQKKDKVFKLLRGQARTEQLLQSLSESGRSRGLVRRSILPLCSVQRGWRSESRIQTGLVSQRK